MSGRGVTVVRQDDDVSKCRVLLRNADTGALYYVLWVELRDRDLYWGSPGVAPDVPGTPIGQGANTIQIPDNFDALPMAHAKISIHASGVMHTTSDGSGAQVTEDVYVGPVTSFKEPTMFAALLTAVPGKKAPYLRASDRGGAIPLIFSAPERLWHHRWYMDFFVTPAGEFAAVPGAFLRDGAVPRNVITQTLDLELDLILAARCEPLPGQGNDWHPDKQILFALNPRPTGAPGTEAPPETQVDH